jgi:hypothetical protein
MLPDILPLIRESIDCVGTFFSSPLPLAGGERRGIAGLVAPIPRVRGGLRKSAKVS